MQVRILAIKLDLERVPAVSAQTCVHGFTHIHGEVNDPLQGLLTVDIWIVTPLPQPGHAPLQNARLIVDLLDYASTELAITMVVQSAFVGLIVLGRDPVSAIAALDSRPRQCQPRRRICRSSLGTLVLGYC